MSWSTDLSPTTLFAGAQHAGRRVYAMPAAGRCTRGGAAWVGTEGCYTGYQSRARSRARSRVRFSQITTNSQSNGSMNRLILNILYIRQSRTSLGPVLDQSRDLRTSLRTSLRTRPQGARLVLRPTSRILSLRYPGFRARLVASNNLSL